MKSTTRVLALGIGIAALTVLSARAADTEKSTVKNGIEGKIVKIDAEKGSLTISDASNHEHTYSVTEQTVIVGPRGGIVRRRLKDHRFHKGMPVTVVVKGSNAAQIHLGYNRKPKEGASAATTSGRAAGSTSAPASASKPKRGASASSSATQTTGFRGVIPSKPAAKPQEEEDEDNEFPGKVKSVDPTKRMLVITLLNGTDRSFLLSNESKVTVRGHLSRRGLSDAAIKPGASLTVVTESGGKKVKEVKVSPAARRMKKKAA